MSCILSTIKELIRPWQRQQQARQQLHLQLLEGALQQPQQLQYLLVTLLRLQAPRLLLLVARPQQQQLQSLLMVVPHQQLQQPSLLQVLP